MGDASPLTDDGSDRKAKQYSSRLSRARTANLNRHKLLDPVSIGSSKASGDDVGGAESMGRELAMSVVQPSTTLHAKPVAPAVEGQLSVLYQPDEEGSSAVFWQWNADNKLMALVEQSQLLKVIDATGKTIYRVQVPPPPPALYCRKDSCLLLRTLTRGGRVNCSPSAY